LLHHAQIIVPLPLLGYLVSFDAVDGYALEFYLLLSRGYPHQFTLVSAAYSPAGDDLVTLSYLILDGDVEVGEGPEERGDKLLGFLGALDVLIGFMPDEISGIHLVDEVWVVLVDDLPRTPC
jgi:hypothetical protein